MLETSVLVSTMDREEHAELRAKAENPRPGYAMLKNFNQPQTFGEFIADRMEISRDDITADVLGMYDHSQAYSKSAKPFFNESMIQFVISELGRGNALLNYRFTKLQEVAASQNRRVSAYEIETVLMEWHRKLRGTNPTLWQDPLRHMESLWDLYQHHLEEQRVQADAAAERERKNAEIAESVAAAEVIVDVPNEIIERYRAMEANYSSTNIHLLPGDWEKLNTGFPWHSVMRANKNKTAK